MKSGGGGKHVALLEIMSWMLIHKLPTSLSSLVFYGLLPVNKGGSIASTTLMSSPGACYICLVGLEAVRGSDLFSGMSGYIYKVEKSEC